MTTFYEMTTLQQNNTADISPTVFFSPTIKSLSSLKSLLGTNRSCKVATEIVILPFQNTTGLPDMALAVMISRKH